MNKVDQLVSKALSEAYKYSDEEAAGEEVHQIDPNCYQDAEEDDNDNAEFQALCK